MAALHIVPLIAEKDRQVFPHLYAAADWELRQPLTPNDLGILPSVGLQQVDAESAVVPAIPPPGHHLQGAAVEFVRCLFLAVLLHHYRQGPIERRIARLVQSASR